MSLRGINFLDKWMAENLLDTLIDDPMAIGVLADRAIEAARKEGIVGTEISEEVSSVFEVIAEAMDPGKAARQARDRYLCRPLWPSSREGESK